MPTYQITDPRTGKKLKVTGDTPPTSAELEQLFSETTRKAAAPAEPASAASRFGSSLWEQVNPVSMATNLATAVRHPINTLDAIGQAQEETAQRGRDAQAQGDMTSAAIHGLASWLPMVGPALDQQYVKGQQGDIAGALGGTAGIAASLLGPKLLMKGAAGVIPQAAREAVAAPLEAMSTSRIADVMSPKGINKKFLRLGNVADKIAPELAAEPGLNAFSRQGFQNAVVGKLHEATTELDAVANARNANKVYNTGPIIKDLMTARGRLTAKTVQHAGMKAGANVVPSPNAARVAAIDQAISEIQQLGPIAHYESLRRIRQAWDGPAKTIYHPSMTADYLSKQGHALGAADVTGAIRDRLAIFDPATAEANARYSLFKNANDVLKATEEVERSRPKTGRQMGGRMAGTILGEQAGGWKGATLGYFIGPPIDAAMHAGVTTKVATARLLSQLADAVRSGSLTRQQGIVRQLANISESSLRTHQLSRGLTPPSDEQQPSTEATSGQ